MITHSVVEGVHADAAAGAGVASGTVGVVALDVFVGATVTGAVVAAAVVSDAAVVCAVVLAAAV